VSIGSISLAASDPKNIRSKSSATLTFLFIEDEFVVGKTGGGALILFGTALDFLLF
jgi:hypothetical protein